MLCILWTIVFFMGWMSTGLIVLSCVDDQEKRLLRWVQEAPYELMKLGAILLWPLVVWKWFRG